MKNFKIILSISFFVLLFLALTGCDDTLLDFQPEDRITVENVPENEEDIKSILNGVYSQLRSNSIYNEGYFGFGILDGATPNAFNWGRTPIARLGTGELSPSDGHIVTHRWTRSYSIINKANFLLEQIENLEYDEEQKTIHRGEAHFLRGFAYAVLANTYGRVPIINTALSTEEARNVSQASIEEVWEQAILDYNVAIENLPVDALQNGRATKGAALGLKMRAYQYQNKFQEVLEITEEIEALGKYSLFPSYEGLFNVENENNSEVLFDIQYMSGANSQGSFHDQFCGTGTGAWNRGTRYVPTDHLVNSYEMAMPGTELSIENHRVPSDGSYANRDPRLYFTVVLPHTEILDHLFPSFIYPGGAFTHRGNSLKHLSGRKYFVEHMSELPASGESEINYILVRYADVILSKAEAIIETGGNVDEAINLINRIRTEREDVTLAELPSGMSREDARDKLRHERRIEFALESLYWSDIKRWEELDGYASDLYPVEVRDHNDNVIETKFPNGYLEFYKYLPIPDNELSLNKNLEQNAGW